MRSIQFLILIATLVFHFVTQAAPLPEKEIQEIKKFTALKSGRGQLLNPPRGSVSAEVLAVREYVRSVVLELSGKELKAQDIHFVINVYGNNDMNAWVMQMDPANENGAEAKWNKENPGEVWPLRKAWGFSGDQKPIFELGITTALLKKLSTRDELAFIMGHELTHLLEGHTDHVEEGQSLEKWWSSQSHEVVADNLGVEKMLGKFELEAALSVMDKLHPKTDDVMSTSDAFAAGAGTHHAEGVRITSLQYFIEYLRRFNSKATVRQQVEIPASVKLDVYGRQEKYKFKGDPKAFSTYLDFVQEMLDRDVEVEKISRKKETETEDLKAFRNGPISDLNAEDLPELIKITVEKLENSNTSKAKKVNAFFEALIYLGSRFDSSQLHAEKTFSNLSDKELFDVARFLLKNSTGPDAWSVNDFKSLIDKHSIEKRPYIEDAFMKSLKGQRLFEKLIQISPNFRALSEHLTSMDSFVVKGSFEAKRLGHIFSNLNADGYPDGKLKQYYRKRIPENFKNYSRPDLVVAKLDDSGLAEYRFIEASHSEADKKPTAENPRSWNDMINEAKAPFEPAYRKQLYLNTIQLLSPSDLKKSGMKNFSIADAFGTIKFDELSSAQQSELKVAYLNYIKTKLNPKRERMRTREAIFSQELRFATDLMQSLKNDRPQYLDILRYILIANASDYTMMMFERAPEARTAVNEAIASLSKEELWTLLGSLTPLEKEVRVEIVEMAKKGKAYVDNLMKTDREAFMKTFEWQGAISSYDLQINILLLSQSENLSLSVEEFKRLLSNIEISKYYRTKSDRLFSKTEAFQTGPASILFDIFSKNLNSLKDWQDVVTTYERLTKVAGPGFNPDVEQENQIRELFQKKLESMNLTEQVQWLKRESIRKAVGGEFTGKQLALYVDSIVGKNRKLLPIETARILKVIPLREKWPDAYVVFRNALAEKQLVQPNELSTVFAEDTRSITQKADAEVNLVRGMSAFSTYTRALPLNEQIEMIEFMMNRSDKMPKTLAETKPEDTKGVDPKQFFMAMREEMKFRTEIERSMVINSILVGPNSILETTEGLKTVKNHLLNAVSTDNREIAETILNGLIAAEGRNKSIIFSYALSQKVEGNGKTGLTEALVLRSLLDSYGVPGVKLAQYLAFTSEFKNFQSALEVYQDAAMPISYFDALKLLQKRLGSTWDPAKYRVKKIIGSGSVNIAIDYENLETGKSEVASIARDEIEVKTKEDFRRFQMLFKELTRTEEQKKKFDFVIGLMELIQKSVTLEFDKEHSFKIQKSVQDLYRQKVDGWNIQTVDAYSVKGMAILMEKAPGVGARKILKTDPAAYQSAMRAFMRVEYGVLRGVDQTNNINPLPLHANPDIHDGQIMIDMATKTLTVLDFGQAVEITNQEREFSLDLLRIISNAESAGSAIDLIQKHSMLIQNKKININVETMKQILKRGDRMNVFVYLLSSLSRSGFDVPLSSVHWLLAANRLIKLGEKVNQSPELSIKWMLGMRKVGLSLSTFNAAKSTVDKTKDLLKGMQLSAPKVNKCSALFN